jgi:hypothetical protein
MTLNAARFFPDGIRRWAVTHVGLAFFLVLSLTLNGLLNAARPAGLRS